MESCESVVVDDGNESSPDSGSGGEDDSSSLQGYRERSSDSDGDQPVEVIHLVKDNSSQEVWIQVEDPDHKFDYPDAGSPRESCLRSESRQIPIHVSISEERMKEINNNTTETGNLKTPGGTSLNFEEMSQEQKIHRSNNSVNILHGLVTSDDLSKGAPMQERDSTQGLETSKREPSSHYEKLPEKISREQCVELVITELLESLPPSSDQNLEDGSHTGAKKVVKVNDMDERESLSSPKDEQILHIASDQQWKEGSEVEKTQEIDGGVVDTECIPSAEDEQKEHSWVTSAKDRDANDRISVEEEVPIINVAFETLKVSASSTLPTEQDVASVPQGKGQLEWVRTDSSPSDVDRLMSGGPQVYGESLRWVYLLDTMEDKTESATLETDYGSLSCVQTSASSITTPSSTSLRNVSSMSGSMDIVPDDKKIAPNTSQCWSGVQDPFSGNRQKESRSVPVHGSCCTACVTWHSSVTVTGS